jgi:protease secretion system outer membrane protein
MDGCVPKLPVKTLRLIIAAIAAYAAPAYAANAVDTKAGGEAGKVRTITLEQAYDMTLRTDESILKAYWQARSAGLEPWSALTRLGPTLSGNAGLSGAGARTSTAGSALNTRTDTGSLGLTFTQTLLDLTALPAYRKGVLMEQAARLTYRYTIRQQLYALAQAYYEVLKQERIVSVYEETIQLAEGQMQVSNAKAQAGEALRSDVLSAQVALESDRQSLIEARNTLRSDRNKLCNLMGIPPLTAFTIAEPPGYADGTISFEKLLAQAMAHREDLRVTALAVDQDVEARNVVTAEYAPTLAAQVDGDYNRITGNTASRAASWNAGLTVSMPFLTGGQREIDVRNASYTVNEARLDYSAQVKTVEQDVTDASLNAQTLEATIRSLRVQVASALQEYEDTRNQYRAGTSTSIDVLNALESLNAARRDLATKTYDYQVALRDLEESSGVFQQQRIERLSFP